MPPNIHTPSEIKENEEIAVALVEEQLIAYNNRDIEGFLKPFSENIKGYNYPDQLFFEGKEKMRAIYSRLFDRCPNLHCETISRTVFNDTVIDKEKVTGMIPNENEFPYFLAIYKIASKEITEIRFLSYVSNQ